MSLVAVMLSGSGTFRRNPESKLEYNEANFQKLLQTQRDILSEGIEYAKPDGMLYYITCSVFEEENLSQISQLLNRKDRQLELVYNETIWPESGGCDGFFLAVLHKK